jgi:uncharacterized membrane protein
MNNPGDAVSHSNFLRVSKHRIDALTDGVCAIVMTLLVLELKVPDLPRTASVADLGAVLRHDRPVFFSFVITFMFASLFWYLHHAMLNFIQELSPALVVMNLAFLLFMSLLPFSVGILGHFMANPLAQTLYFANHFFMSLTLFVLWRIALSRGVVNEPHSLQAKRLGLRIGAIPLGACVAAMTTWIRPEFSFYAFLLVLLASRAYSRKQYGR